jgi:hypothetical protein
VTGKYVSLYNLNITIIGYRSSIEHTIKEK